MATILMSAQLIWGLLSIIFGILILVFPKMLNYLIAFYFIIVGLLMVLPAVGVGV